MQINNLDEIFQQASAITIYFKSNYQGENQMKNVNYNPNLPTVTPDQFLARTQQALQPKPITPGQRYLLASAGVSTAQRNKMTDQDIRDKENYYKTEDGSMAPAQVEYFQKVFGANPSADWDYKSARKVIINHLQQTDFDPVLQQHMNEYSQSWNSKQLAKTSTVAQPKYAWADDEDETF